MDSVGFDTTVTKGMASSLANRVHNVKAAIPTLSDFKDGTNIVLLFACTIPWRR